MSGHPLSGVSRVPPGDSWTTLAERRRTPSTAIWLALLLFLFLARLPSLVQPAGGDQGLYAYEGQRILAGDVMYRDMWDQKPPAIAFIYASLLAIRDHEAVVPMADLVCAAAVALMLVSIGRRRFSPTVGYGAAACYVLLGDPYLQRLSGLFVRAQCEPFINVAICGGLLLLAHTSRTRPRLVAIGIALATAFWLKYNAVAYALPFAAALWAWSSRPTNARDLTRQACWVALGFLAVGGIVLAYFAAQGALRDLYRATVLYNLGYSNETYRSPAGVLVYLATFPLERARVDFLWFIGGLGAVLLVLRARADRSSVVVLSSLLAACLSIAINGSRDLPNYFVQAAPSLALCASAGLSTLARSPRWLRYAAAALVVGGLWRIGPDEPAFGMRLASLPGFVENLQFDLRYARGQMSREAYLQRFSGKKYNASEIESLSQYIQQASRPGERVLVFGFSGGSVCWKSHRASASRFFWSMPVIREFDAGRRGYGSEGLLADLNRDPPAVVALQKEEWRSRDFFFEKDSLRGWLEGGYRLHHETPMFSVWLRR
jgi:hypothetical protein